MTISHLRVNDEVRPLNVGDHVRFTWRSNTNNPVQVLVYAAGGTTIWRSGQVTAGAIEYSGAPLPANTQFEWEVRGTNSSTTAWFETAPDAESWRAASWISIPRGPAAPADRRPAVYIRREFWVEPGLIRARLFATAGGLYRPWLNGESVPGAGFAPGWTDYRFRVPFHAYSLEVREGQNTLGAILGDGWYSGYVGPFGAREIWGETPVFRAVLLLEYRDRTQTVVTDESWEGAFGAIEGSDLLHGEVFDARRRLRGWSAGGGSGEWTAATALNGPEGVLQAALIAPASAVREMPAQRTHVVDDGSTIVDFGQNLAGWVKLSLRGPSGTVIRVRHAEILDDSGRLYFDNLRGARSTEFIVLDGDPLEYEPSFTYHGFRYAEITAPSGVAEPEQARAVALSSIPEFIGGLVTDNPLVNQLQSNIQWTMRSNFIEVPTDCPQRDERLGWGGDAQVFVPTASFNADLNAFYAKWTCDLLDAQKPNGAFADIAPGRVVDFAEVGAAGYADAGVFVPWYTYQAYGDASILRRAYAGAKAWVTYIHSNNPGLVWRDKRNTDYGDWLAIEETDKALVATAYFARAVQIVARYAAVLGVDADREYYETLHSRIVTAYRDEFWQQENRACSTQTAYTLALAFDLLMDQQRPLAQEALVAEVENTGYLTVGFLAVRHILHELTGAGRTDLAMKALLREDSPSWGHQIARGATTIGEHWDAWDETGTIKDPAMNSFNHFCFGSVGEWMYHEIGAIAPLSPGYERFRVRPAAGYGIDQASAFHESPRGRIETSWSCDQGRLSIEVTVPFGATAEIILPSVSHIVGGGVHSFTDALIGTHQAGSRTS